MNGSSVWKFGTHKRIMVYLKYTKQTTYGDGVNEKSHPISWNFDSANPLDKPKISFLPLAKIRMIHPCLFVSM